MLAATLDFEDMLRTAQPPISVLSPWQEVAPRLSMDPRFEALNARQRRLAFDSHRESLLQLQALALEQARAQYLVRGPLLAWMQASGSRWQKATCKRILWLI